MPEKWTAVLNSSSSAIREIEYGLQPGSQTVVEVTRQILGRTMEDQLVAKQRRLQCLSTAYSITSRLSKATTAASSSSRREAKMDAKQAAMDQVRQQAALANARLLMEVMRCIESCSDAAYSKLSSR